MSERVVEGYSEAVLDAARKKIQQQEYEAKARAVETREPDPRSPLVTNPNKAFNEQLVKEGVLTQEEADGLTTVVHRATFKTAITPSNGNALPARTWDEFMREARTLLEPTAAGKGYNDTGVDGKNELFEFVQNVAQGSGHALGEIIYKAVRYSRKKDSHDLLKIAAWAYLAWKFEK